MPTVAAEPLPYDFPRGKLGLVVIDMQRGFAEPGGFGDPLGKDAARLRAIVPTVIHTRECHRPDPAAPRLTPLAFGVITEICVQTTMRQANDRGLVCLLVEDATESYFAEFKVATLRMVRAQGAIVGRTAAADRLVTALDG